MSVFGTVCAGRVGDSAITVSISGATDTTLTIDQLVARYITLSGALTANVNVIAPAAAGDAGVSWLIYNNTSGAFTLTFKNSTGTGVAIAQGKRALIIWDGTNMVSYPSDATANGFAKSGANTDITSLAGITSGITAQGGMNLSGNLGGNSSASAPLSFGRLSLSVAGSANVTLTAAQYANPILEFTGVLTGNISVFVPLTAGAEWQVYNGTTGSFTLTVIGATGTGVVVTQSQRQRVYTDGTNVYAGTTDAPNLCVGNGTSVTKIVVYTPSLSPALVNANTTAEQTFTVTGLTTSDTILACNKPTAQAGLGIVGVRVSASDTLAITFSNNTGSGITPTASQTYRVVALRS
jgi:hypothetical protein